MFCKQTPMIKSKSDQYWCHGQIIGQILGQETYISIKKNISKKRVKIQFVLIFIIV